MNLSAYDVISPKLNKTKTWINVEKYQLLSREISYRRYVTISKRFNKDCQDYEYFVILLDNSPIDRDYSKTKLDDYGRIKISLKSIWKETMLNYYKQDVNINLELIEHTDDGDIYKLDI